MLMIACFLLFAPMLWAQDVKGHVTDAETKEALAGVNVYYKDNGGTRGTVTDINGYYEIKVADGEAEITFSYLGYETERHRVTIASGEFLTHDVAMRTQANLMDEVVVSVGRYEQKLSDITVSMDLLKAQEITRQSPKDLTDVLKNVSGVDLNDRQPSVRGGTGWTYSVGSRVLVMVDGMSILTPGTGEINWNMVPMENIDQVEVLKGASSVLYGSSALNGLIHVKTKRPGMEPATSVSFRGGLYGKPRQAGTPMFGNLDLSHSRRIGHLDLTVAANGILDDSYRQDNYNKRARAGMNLTYHDPRVYGLNYGANINYLYNDYKGFFMWRSPEEYYVQSPLANMGRQEHTFYIDPFLNFTNAEKQTTHRLKGRFFHRASRIISTQRDLTILDILDNMGFSDRSIAPLMNVAQNWQTTLLPGILAELPNVMNGHLGGLVNQAVSLSQQIFPSASTADYIDLLSWVMQHRPFPDQNNLGAWLVDATKPQEKQAPGVFDHTYAYNLDYQFSKKFDQAQFTVGGTYERIHAKSEMTGTHTSDNVALFAQYDHKLFDRLNLSAGVRFEYYRVDEHYREAETKLLGMKVPFKPVFRAGLNYELGEYSFLRASFGQGYRYPSVTEKFILKDIGGMGAYPNSQLKAEEGYNAELGLKQGYQFGPVKGFVDVAGFYTRYKDMIEFRFGLFNKTTFAYIDALSKLMSTLQGGEGIGIGAQFTNVGRAEIYGVDLSTTGTWTFNKQSKLNYMLGYVYTNPIDMDHVAREAEEEANTDLLAQRSKSNDSKYLKYRQKHSVKAVLDWEWRRFNIGTNLAWKSKTLAADWFIVDEREKAQPDVMDYLRQLLYGDVTGDWMANNKGYFVMDLRAGVRLNRYLHLQALINNVLNKRYCTRPMDVAAPRTFMVQLSADF